jgi:Prokaryotic Cytochrome C oxidase subunit IV
MAATSLFRSRVVATWAVLTVATTITWYLGDGHGSEDVASVAVLAVAFLKVYLVGREFMELRGAPRALHVLFAGWCAVVWTGLVSLYLATA